MQTVAANILNKYNNKFKKILNKHSKTTKMKHSSCLGIG